MSFPWLRNLAGSNLDELSLQSISRPNLELTLHVTTKTVQAGGLLGTCMIGPIYSLSKGQKDRDSIKLHAENFGKYGLLIGLLAGPILTYGTVRGASIDAVWDRCYRLRCSKNQLRVDRLCAVGAAAGFATATYLGESGTLGTLIGMNGGVLLATLLNSAF